MLLRRTFQQEDHDVVQSGVAHQSRVKYVID